MPDETQVGKIPVTTPDGGQTAVMIRLIEQGRPIADVVWSPLAARRTALAMLAMAFEATPLEPKRDAVLLRSPAGTPVALALKAVFSEMYGLCPIDDPAAVRVHVVEDLGGRLAGDESDLELAAYHRALHDEEEADAGSVR